MSDVAPLRVRIDLTPPQAVTQTSGLLFEPARDRGQDAVVLAPGAGTDVLHPVLLEVAKGLAEAGHPVLLFNFPFTETGRKRPDHPGRLERAYIDAITWLRTRLGDQRGIFIGGRSLGGRIASRIAAQGVDTAGLVLLGYPLHPRRRRGDEVDRTRLRTEHWDDLRVPVLFVQGDRDGLCDLDALEHERRLHLAQVPSQVHVVTGGDHAFGVRARDPRTTAEIMEHVRDIVVRWVGEFQHTSAAS
jgi:uncharacterized protein